MKPIFRFKTNIYFRIKMSKSNNKFKLIKNLIKKSKQFFIVLKVKRILILNLVQAYNNH